MKHLSCLVVLLASLTSLASPYTLCTPVELSSDFQTQYLLYLSRSGKFNQNGAFNHHLKYFNGVNAGPEKIEDLVVNLNKVTFHDEQKSINYGVIGKSVTTTKSFAVSLTLSSESTVLGTKLVGCSLVDAHEISAVVICNQSETNVTSVE